MFQKEEVKVIYILSSGHSGSTVVGSILGSTRNVIHVGELSNLVKVIDGRLETCSCFKSPDNCVFWGKIIEDFTAYLSNKNLSIIDYERNRLDVESKVLSDRRNTIGLNIYAELQKELFRLIGKNSGKHIVVDSSKSPTRALALSYALKSDIKIVFISRNLLGIMHSYERKYTTDFKRLGFLYSLIIERLKFYYVFIFSSTKTIIFRFSNIKNQTKWNTLLNKLDIDASISVNDRFYNYHIIAGNRMRFQKFFTIR